MDPPSQPSTNAVASAATQLSHPDSANSSPRHRHADTCDDSLPPVPGAKLRFMCSYGGHIIPRPHDKSLCYVGGDTRMVVVDRHSSLSDFSSRISRTLFHGRLFTLKYQLPNEDLDSLISVATDEDLENMIEEYDRVTTISSLKPARLRLFLFLAKPETAASMGSLLDDAKSETWFVDALNGTGFDLPRGLSDSAAVDCLLELDEGDGIVQTDSRAEVDIDHKHGKINPNNVLATMPDSPLVETNSSFGSSSSSPSMSNLPPIKVRVEDVGGGWAQMVGLDDQFSHLNVAPPPLPTVIGGGYQMVGLNQQQFVHMNVALPPLPTVIGGGAMAVSAGGACSAAVSDEDRLDQGGPTTGFRKPPLPVQPVQRRVVDVCNLQSPDSKVGAGGFMNLPSPDSVASESSIASETLSKYTIYQEPTHVQTSESRAPAIPNDPEANIQDPGSQQLHDSAYMLPGQQIQQQQFFYTNNPHFVQHPVTGQQLSYYQMGAPQPSQPPHHHQHHHQMDQQYPMYFYQGAQTMTSNSTTVAPSAVYNEPNPPIYLTKPATSEMTGNVNRNSAMATPPPAIQVPSHQYQQQYMGVPPMHHHPSQSIAANYGFEYPHQQTHEQVYYAQHPAAPIPPQYQTMSPATAVFLSHASAQLPPDTTSQQIRNSQAL